MKKNLSSNHYISKSNINPRIQKSKPLNLKYINKTLNKKETIDFNPIKSAKCIPKPMSPTVNVDLSKLRCNTQSFQKKENTELLKSVLDIECKKKLTQIICTYEYAITSIFSSVKELIKEDKYIKIRNDFFRNVEKGFSECNKIERNNSSNSIIKYLQDSKDKYIFKGYNYIDNYNTQNTKNRFKFNSSLYNLTKKREDNESPDKKYLNTSCNNYSNTIKYNAFKKSITLHNNQNKGKNKTFFKRNHIPKLSVKINNLNNGRNKKIESYNRHDQYICHTQIFPDKHKNTISHTNTKNEQSQNVDLLSKIKSSLNDDLKGFFEFSYENFLNKESDRDCTKRSEREDYKFIHY